MVNAVPRGVQRVFATLVVWLAVAGVAGASDADAVHRAIADMLAAAQMMVDGGERRDTVRMVAEAERLVAAGERALAALPRPGNRHARDAADHVRQAIDHARQVLAAAKHGRSGEALAEARRTLSQVRRGAGHADAL